MNYQLPEQQIYFHKNLLEEIMEDDLKLLSSLYYRITIYCKNSNTKCPSFEEFLIFAQTHSPALNLIKRDSSG